MAVKRRLEAASRSPLAERILAQRERGGAEVSLERLEADFADASRYDIVASLKELEKAGRGQFVVGRKGQRSRFVWGDATGGSAAPLKPAPAAKPVPVTKSVAAKPAPAAKPVSVAEKPVPLPKPAPKAVTKPVRVAK